MANLENQIGYNKVDQLWHPERAYNGDSTWIAKRDLLTVKAVTLKPRSLVFVDIGLPRSVTNPYIAQGDAHPMLSSRSLIAQLNAEVLPESAKIVAEAAKHNETKCEVGLQSYADHTITLQEGTGIGRLARWSMDTLRGSELEQLVETGIVKIHGERGKEWGYYRNRNGTSIGLHMQLDPTYRMHLPKSNAEIILTSDISGKRFRHTIDSWLKPINEDLPQIEISQTLAHLYLPPGIHGLIDDSLTDVPGNRHHINSLFIYGGETGIFGTEEPWPIRTEILRPDYGPQPNYIVIMLSKSGYDLAA